MAGFNKTMKKPINIVFQPPTFRQYEPPDGCLISNPACHALWYYYIVAYENYRTYVIDPIIMEGDPDPVVNFKQLFSSIALAYGVKPEKMIKFWDKIDAQCFILGIPELPDQEEYRFNTTPELRTQ